MNVDNQYKTERLCYVLQLSAIQAQTDLKRCTYDSTLALGKKLRENPKTGQVTSVKDTMSDLEMTWSDFELALRDTKEQVNMQ